MKFAAIDIGSNAVRLLVSQVIDIKGETYFQKVSFTRVPIRLGEDVFDSGKISEKKAKSLVKTMKAFSLLMDVQDVVSFRACATSAMREAGNGEEVIERIKAQSNVSIDLISGSEEANLIFGNFRHQKLDKKKNYLYIDVGGGSTELSIIKDGKRVKAKSFRIGTVRALKDKVKPAVWADIKEWVKEELKAENKLVGIGTGGNINRLYKMSSCKMNSPITLQEMKDLHEMIDDYSWEERISELRLKPDRADVITHASEIYIKTMQLAGVKKMFVPRVGLSDGIIIDLFKKHV